MSLSSFLSSLSPSFEKGQIVESIQKTRDDIARFTLPALAAAEELWSGQKFKNGISQDIQDTVQGALKRKPMFELLVANTENADKLLKALGEHVNKIFNSHESTRALTYAKATCLRLVQAADLVSLYNRRQLNYIYWLEADAMGVEDAVGPKPAELEWLRDNMPAYVTGLRALEYDPNDLDTVFRTLPDVPVSAQNEAALGVTMGVSKIDPMGVFGLSVRWNPFYLAGMLVAEYQQAKYKSTEEEAQLLEYRLLQLKNQREKTPDAKLDKEIAYTQERVTSAHAKLSKMEKDYNV